MNTGSNSRRGRARRLRDAAVCALLCQACATLPSSATRDVRSKAAQNQGTPVIQAELRDSIERFTGQFLDRVGDAMRALEVRNSPELMQLALRQETVYASSALDIATGPLPEVNLLDMLVFVTLSRWALERHWVPAVFGERAQPLVAAFASAEQTLTEMSETILDPAQSGQLAEFIQAWKDSHAEQVRVEWVRFQDFSSHSGQVARDQERRAAGLLGSVRSAAQTADQAVGLAERGLFLANRLPSLIRMQARLGAMETIDDSMRRLQDVDALIGTAPKLRPLLNDTAQLATNASVAAREGRQLVEALEPLLRSLQIIRPEGEQEKLPPTLELAKVERLVDSSNQLTDHSLALTREVRSLVDSENVAQTVSLIGARADSLVRRWIGYLVALGAAWMLLYWGGYYIVKRGIAFGSPPSKTPVAEHANQSGYNEEVHHDW
jgi:hypothetical protein